MSAHKVFGIAGWKNSGKTVLIEALVREFVSRDYRVATIKHAHHDFDIDVPGKDSYRHRAAGAREVLVASSKRWALIHELRDENEPALDELLAHLAPCDLVLVEGFKRGPHPKLEVVRGLRSEGLIADRDRTVCAIASDDQEIATRLPRFPLCAAPAIADFICETLVLAPRSPPLSDLEP